MRTTERTNSEATILQQLRPLETIGGMTYINVYRDEDGKRHYSTEEFSQGQEGIFNYHMALEEAYKLSVLGEWEYVETLCSNTPRAISARIEAHLDVLETAVTIVRGAGIVADHLDVDELQEKAADIMERSRS